MGYSVSPEILAEIVKKLYLMFHKLAISEILHGRMSIGVAERSPIDILTCLTKSLYF